MNITVKASDGKGGAAEYKFKVIISSPENDPPYINNSMSNISIKEGFGTQH